jgi:hypothetical protein
VKRLTYQRSEQSVIDFRQLDPYPAGWTDIRGPEIDLRRFVDEGLLHTGTRWQPHGHVAIVVVIVGKHGKDTPRREERRLAMRDSLHRSRNRQAGAPQASELRAVVFPGSCEGVGSGAAHFTEAEAGETEAVINRRPDRRRSRIYTVLHERRHLAGGDGRCHGKSREKFRTESCVCARELARPHVGGPLGGSATAS